MKERIYKTMKSAGAFDLSMGILVLCLGMTAGIMMIVNGAKLLARKSDITF